MYPLAQFLLFIRRAILSLKLPLAYFLLLKFKLSDEKKTFIFLPFYSRIFHPNHSLFSNDNQWKIRCFETFVSRLYQSSKNK